MAGLVSTLFLGACSVFGIRSGTEEAPYTVVDTLTDDIEVRAYGRRLAADVVVEGDEAGARSTGFRALAAYIFADDRPGAKISMTAPVAQSADSAASATGPAADAIAMTAPVAQSRAGEGRWRIRFFMPAEHTLDTLPPPANPDITIVELAPVTLAVLRFSGSRRPAEVHRAVQRLSAKLDGSGWQPDGPPQALFYDPPWTLAFLRRNEVAIAVVAGQPDVTPAQ